MSSDSEVEVKKRERVCVRQNAEGAWFRFLVVVGAESA